VFEDEGSKVLRNVGILPQHYRVFEDEGSKVHRYGGILLHVSQPMFPHAFTLYVRCLSQM